MGSAKQNGFTLVEVIVVTVIMGIMAAFVAPNFWDWLPNMRLKAAARDLYSSMQKARVMAVKGSRNTAITFDTANNKYDLCDNWNTTTGSCAGAIQSIVLTGYKSGVGYGHGNASQQVSGGGFPGNNVSYASNRVIFNSQGLGTTGYVYLDHENNTTTYAIGSQTSGVIKLFKWSGGSWK